MPASVTNLTAIVTGLSCQLTWTNAPLSGGVAVQRTIPLASTQVGGPTNYQTLALLPAGQTSYSDTIQEGSAYTYKVITLPEDVSLPHFNDAGVTVSIALGGTQPHRDTTRPPSGPTPGSPDFSPPIVLNGTSTAPWSNSDGSDIAPVFPANGIPFNQ
jgi:hypothetical protein